MNSALFFLMLTAVGDDQYARVVNHNPTVQISHDLNARPVDAYAAARTRAIRENKPLIVWSGDAICPACVHDTADEWVSFVGTHPDLTPNALTVAVPEGGDLWRVATITTWTTGDSVHGHVPSIRRALANWRANRTVTAAAPSMMYRPAAPMMTTRAPMMMSGGVGGCASCGSSSRGLFGRR